VWTEANRCCASPCQDAVSQVPKRPTSQSHIGLAEAIITTIAVVTIAHSSEILHLMALNEVRRPRIGNDEHTVLVFTASSCRSSRVSCSHPPLPVSEEPERHAAKRIPNAPPLVFQVSKTSKLPLLCKFMIDPFTSGRWWPGGTLFFVEKMAR
jgi:hypothetical protein